MEWTTADEASTLTGQEIAESELEAAAVDVYEVMRWTPIAGVDLVDSGMSRVSRRSALGRAIAWQAVYRRTVDPVDLLSPKELSSVSIGSYSESYVDGSGSGSNPIVAKRVRRILAEAGLIRLTGTTGPVRETENIIPIVT